MFILWSSEVWEKTNPTGFAIGWPCDVHRRSRLFKLVSNNFYSYCLCLWLVWKKLVEQCLCNAHCLSFCHVRRMTKRPNEHLRLHRSTCYSYESKRKKYEVHIWENTLPSTDSFHTASHSIPISTSPPMWLKEQKEERERERGGGREEGGREVRVGIGLWERERERERERGGGGRHRVLGFAELCKFVPS